MITRGDVFGWLRRALSTDKAMGTLGESSQMRQMLRCRVVNKQHSRGRSVDRQPEPLVHSPALTDHK